MRFLFVDKILELNPGKSIKGIKHITQDDFYLKPDEKGKLFFIPPLVGETLGQLAAWNVMFNNNFTLRPVAGIAASAKVLRHVYVGETLLLESFIDHLDESVVQYHSVAKVKDEEVFILRGALGPLLPMQDFIDTNLVKQQFNQIYRPMPCHPVELATRDLLNNMEIPRCARNDDALSRLSLSPTTGLGPIAAPMIFDRIITCEPGVNLSAEKCINFAAPYFADHFPCKPVLPMTVLLECKLNLARDFIKLSNFSQNYQVREVHKVKMKDFIQPGDVVTTNVKIKSQSDTKLVLNFQSEVNQQLVCVLDLIMITPTVLPNYNENSSAKSMQFQEN